MYKLYIAHYFHRTGTFLPRALISYCRDISEIHFIFYFLPSALRVPEISVTVIIICFSASSGPPTIKTKKNDEVAAIPGIF